MDDSESFCFVTLHDNEWMIKIEELFSRELGDKFFIFRRETAYFKEQEEQSKSRSAPVTAVIRHETSIP